MITTAEFFFVRHLSSIATLTTFDELRDDTYHNKSIKLDLEKLPSTSSPIKLHIQRAYLHRVHTGQGKPGKPGKPGKWV